MRREIVRTPAVPARALLGACAILACLALSAGAAWADTPEVISPTGTISTPTPTIRVKFIGTSTTNVYGAVLKTIPEAMSLRLDGSLIAFTTSPVATSYPVTYEMIASGPVLTPLSEGIHTVVASSSTGSITWTFEYRRNENSACRGCHGEFNGIHLDMAPVSDMAHTYYDYRYDMYPPVLADQHAACMWCHQKLDTVVNDPGQFTDHKYDSQFSVNVDQLVAGRWCLICHVKPFFDAESKYELHGSRAAFSYSDLPSGAAIQTPRESMDCVYCHQQGAAQPEGVGPHDLVDDHTVGLDSGCQGSCHSADIAEEHTLRASDSGASLICDMCHLSSDSRVRGISGKQWQGNTDRWEASIHANDTPAGYSYEYDLGPWSYTRDGVSVPVTQVKVRTKGTAEASLYAYYDEQWNIVLQIADRPASTYLAGITTVHDPDAEYQLSLPGATAFKWHVVPRSNRDMHDGIRSGITVMETNPARPAVTCSSCHGVTDHRALHGEVATGACRDCHTGGAEGTNLLDVHVALACGTCHDQAIARATVTAAVAAGDGACMSCHNPDAHEVTVPHTASTMSSSTAVFGAQCKECHSTDFKGVHATGTGLVGEVLCMLCHQPGNTITKELLATKSTTCDGCHAVRYVGHWAEHETPGIDGDCGNCHGQNLPLAHANNAAGCALCHAGARPTQVAFSETVCGECHEAGHGQSLVPSGTVDIYLDPRFLWSEPLDASLFVGESWMPAGLPTETCEVALGGRAAGVSVADAWTSFAAEMAARGWTVPLTGPEDGSERFEATLTHQVAVPAATGTTRFCKVVLYDGATHGDETATDRGTRAEVAWWVEAQ